MASSCSRLIIAKSRLHIQLTIDSEILEKTLTSHHYLPNNLVEFLIALICVAIRQIAKSSSKCPALFQGWRPCKADYVRCIQRKQI